MKFIFHVQSLVRIPAAKPNDDELARSITSSYESNFNNDITGPKIYANQILSHNMMKKNGMKPLHEQSSYHLAHH